MDILTSQNNLYLNIYEFNNYKSINNDNNEDTNNDKDLFESILFECQCALFIVDSTSKESLDYVEKKNKEIELLKYPYMNRIIVLNKNDLSEKVVSEEDAKKIENINEVISISLKTDNGYQQLIDLIYQALYMNKNELAINLIGDITKNRKNFNFSKETTKIIRIVLLGDAAVGKTSMIRRFFTNSFSNNMMMTISISDESKFLKIGDSFVTLKLWDTAGQERFKSLPKNLYQNADGILLLFDVTKQSTFEGITEWMENIKEKLGDVDKKSKRYPVVYLLGNKTDSEERTVSKEAAETKVKELEMEYYDISAKLNINIFEVIMRMTFEIFKKKVGDSETVSLSMNKKEKKSKC